MFSSNCQERHIVYICSGARILGTLPVAELWVRAHKHTLWWTGAHAHA